MFMHENGGSVGRRTVSTSNVLLPAAKAARGRRLCALALAAVLMSSGLSLADPPPVSAGGSNGCQERWTGSWMAAMQANSSAPGPGSPLPTAFSDQTMRMIVAPHNNGDALRITLSNRLGTGPVTFDSVHVGVQDSQAKVASGTNRPVLFGGKSSVTIPAGATATSDGIAFDVVAFRHLAVSFHVVGGPVVVDEHPEPAQESYLSLPGSGDLAARPDGVGFSPVPGLYALEALEVRTSRPVGTVVAFGDSITDGAGSTWGTDNRYPDLLQKKLQAKSGGDRITVLNAGIGGNAISLSTPFTGPSGVSRFSHDVNSRPGVTDVIVLEGINDIGAFGATADQVTTALSNIVTQAHARGYTVTVGTLLPFQGATYHTPVAEATRQAVNEWIRTADSIDHVVDFDRALQDPTNALRLDPAYDSGDHLHPSDAGYAKMASVVDLSSFHTTC